MRISKFVTSITSLSFASIVFTLFAAQASGQEIFGAKFTHQLTPPEFCTNPKSDMCTWVMREAQGNPRRVTAPRDGVISKIRLVACAPGGSFVLQIVRVRTGEKVVVVSTGPVINYQGTRRNCRVARGFDVEEFDVSVPVSKGDSLAVIATEVRFMYNASSGPSIMFDPPLAEGDAPRTRGDLASGFLMMQAELAPH